MCAPSERAVRALAARMVAFPLAPLLALINNFVEIRVDAFKLCYLAKRAEPKGAQDIGTWYTILEIMATAAVITNSALVVFTSKAIFGSYSEPNKWKAFFLMEHVILLIKYIFTLAVADVPDEVTMQLSRQAHIVGKVVLHEADDDDAIEGGAASETDDLEALKIFEDERARVVSFSALEDRLTSAETHE